MKMTAAEFNKKFPIGTEVKYTPVLKRPGGVFSVTRSEAWELGHGDVVVSINGISGGVSIEHLQPTLPDTHCAGDAESQG